MNKKAFTLGELAVVAGIFIVMIMVLAPFVRMAKHKAGAINCANNLRKISLGLHTYAADHNGIFPKDLKELYPSYVDDEKAFDCPASKTFGTKDNPDYDYIAGLTEASSPKEVIVKDFEANHKKAGKNILRVNGSVEWVSARQ